MKYIAIYATLLGLAFCGPVIREKRQTATNCVEPAIGNPCSTNLGQVYFPHPTDNTKFLQCSQDGRMYIIKCPSGEIYEQTMKRCSRQGVTNPTTYNPCTAENIALGLIFFVYPNDNTKFIECNGLNQPLVLTCPSRLVYSPARQSCLLPTGGIVVTTAPPAVINTGSGGVSSNPCPGVITDVNQNLLFPHPDKTKFIQCDLAGDPFVMSCPAGLIWNDRSKTCDTPYHVNFGTINTGTVG